MEELILFPWNNNFNTGNDHIDDHHVHIVSSLNVLVDQVLNYSNNEHTNIETKIRIEKLKDFIEHHFKCEENLMEKFLGNDKLRSDHLRDHAFFMDKINSIKNFDQSDELIDSCYFLINWFINHILVTDFQMVQVIKKLEAGVDIDKAKEEIDVIMRIKSYTRIGFILDLYKNIYIKTMDLMREISSRKEAENSLIKARQEAIMAMNAKSIFLANMSHEIRTPLNGIIGMSDLMIETKLDGEQKVIMESIIQSSKNLLFLLNEILDFSKIESGKMELEFIPFNFREFLIGIIKPLDVLATKKNLMFNFDIDELDYYIIGDANRLTQIINNIIGNAIKFTEKGSILFKTNILAGSGKYDLIIEFIIKDTGIGISEEAKQKLFLPFHQADVSTSRKHGGTGLGLSITNKIVKLMEGKINLKSEIGVGTEFVIQIPFNKGLQLPKENKLNENNYSFVKSKDTDNRLSGAILVAEDVEINQQLMSRILTKFGCDYKIVSNGLEVIEEIKKRKYDLILMDCQMPEMDGYEATRLIRSNSFINSQDITIIALTANATTFDREKCLNSGMNGFLSKPITIKKIYEVLSKHLNKIKDQPTEQK